MPLRLPYLTLAMFLMILALLVTLTRAHDQDSQRTTLISDVLWMEQNLQFRLDRNASQLSQIGSALISGQTSPQTEAQLSQLLRADSGFVRIIWLDKTGAMQGATPPITDALVIGEGRNAVPEQSIFQLATSVGRPVYGPAYEVAGGGYHFEVHVPAYNDVGIIGAVVGIYSLQNLVVRELPWWFTERYRVSVREPDGGEIAAKSKVAPLSDTQRYTMAFDPPGHGLLLEISAYKGETRWIPVLLIASIVLLGGTIVWSIWQLRTQLMRRQAAEQALRGETLFRKAMEDSLLTGLRARDLDGRVTFVNPAFCRMVGFSAEELIDRLPPMPYWDPDHIDRTLEVHEQILAGNAPPQGVELQLRRKNGERISTMIFEAPLIDADGRHTGWMGSMLDITEQKRARELARQQDERLQATSRLITMGEMASTLAHELNQPLAAITSYNNGCLNRLADGMNDIDELRDIHERIARQANRAGQIIRRVHDFVRRSEPKREPLNLNVVIADAVGLLEADTRKRGMRVVTNLGQRLPDVAADPVMIEQVVVNLVRNGMDAMHGQPRRRNTVTLSTHEEGGHVIVRVSDQGTGIEPDTARRLFEPFFSTKQEGMGMGLNICRSIAELHRGRLGFEPHIDGGTTFILSLPVEQVPS